MSGSCPASYIDVLCFNPVVCGRGDLTISLGSSCSASAAFWIWITACSVLYHSSRPQGRELLSLSCLVVSLFHLYHLVNLPDWCGWLSSWDGMQRYVWYTRAGLMLCCCLFFFSSCICDFWVGGDTASLFCKETFWDGQILGAYAPRISAIGVMGRWWHIWWGFPGSGLALPRSQLKALEVCGCAKFAHILPNALCHAGGKHLTLQRENILSRCPGCWYQRFVQHILLDPRDDIASLLCREKERAEALKGKEDKLHTYSGLSWTSAIGIILWKRVIHPLLSILPLQIFSMERMSNIRIWHLDQWQQHKLHALVTSVSMEPQNKLWHVLAFTGPRFKPSY